MPDVGSKLASSCFRLGSIDCTWYCIWHALLFERANPGVLRDTTRFVGGDRFDEEPRDRSSYPVEAM